MMSTIMIIKIWGEHVVKRYKSPILGPYTGNPWVKQSPSDPTNVSEVVEVFFGEIKKKNKYYVKKLIVKKLMKATVLAESYISSIFIVIYELQQCLLTVAR